MYCKNCKREIVEDSIYCRYCGTRQTLQKDNTNYSDNSPFKKFCIFIYPLTVRLIAWGIIAIVTWNGVYYGFRWLNEPPVESFESIQNFYKFGVIHHHN